ALVQGDPDGDAGIVDLPIRDTYQSGRREVARPDEPAKPALTRWRVVERFAGAALLDVELETGRQHQIRLHLAHVGLPVMGDAVYGRRREPGRERARGRRPPRERSPGPAATASSPAGLSAPRQML